MFQSVACGIAFVYVKYMGLHLQIITLFVQLFIAAVTFVIVESRATRVTNSLVISARSSAGEANAKSPENSTSLDEGWPKT